MADNWRSRTITQGAARSPNRAMLRAVGFGDGDFEKAIVGVANGHSTMNPCNAGIQPLVDRAAAKFRSTDGDLREVTRTILTSPEFMSADVYRAKIKTPFELVVSAVRALGTDVDTPMPLVQWVGRIGEPLYQCQPPTGYSDKAETWVNTGALLNRLNYALALAGNKMRGARTDVASLLGVDSSADPKAALDRAVQVFLGGQAGPTTVETLEKQLDNPQVLQAKLDDARKQVDLGVVAGLVLGAPEFQRR